MFNAILMMFQSSFYVPNFITRSFLLTFVNEQQKYRRRYDSAHNSMHIYLTIFDYLNAYCLAYISKIVLSKEYMPIKRSVIWSNLRSIIFIAPLLYYIVFLCTRINEKKKKMFLGLLMTNEMGCTS